MEMMISMAIISVVVMGGGFYIQWLSSMDKTTQSVSDSLLSDRSLRGLQTQLERASIMRRGALSCLPQTVLTGNTLTSSFNLIESGFTFAYSRYSMVVATDTQNRNSLMVPGDMKLRVGDLVLLKTVDSRGRMGFFKVKEILRPEQRIEVEPADAATSLPSEIRCKLDLAAQNDLINPLSPMKFSLDVVEFVSYQLESSTDRSSAKALTVRRYRDFYSTDVLKDLAMNRVIEATVNQTFQKTGVESGTYRADVLVKYLDSGDVVGSEKRDVQKQIQIAGGFFINGEGIFNEYTNPVLPYNNEIFPTCSLSATPMDNYFIDKSISPTSSGYGERIPVVRLEAVYTEADVLTGSMSPQIRASLVPEAPSTSSSRCWTYRDIEWPESGSSESPVLKTPSLSNAVDFEPMVSGAFTYLQTTSLVIPVFCSLPVANAISGVLTYSSPGSYSNKTINCTATRSESTVPVVKTWVYQDRESYCKRRSFSIVVGNLVSTDGQTRGPELYYDNSSCTWNDPVWDAQRGAWDYERFVYPDSPCEFSNLPRSLRTRMLNPRLAKVKLRPMNSIIKNLSGDTLPLEITCSGGY